VAQGGIRAAAAVALAAGAEALAPAPDAADFLVGAALAGAGAWLLGRAGILALATAAAWFAGTLGAPWVLLYRGPLIQLLLGGRDERALAAAAEGRRTAAGRRAIVTAAWVGGLLPATFARPVTAGAAAAAAGLLAWGARGAAADRRRELAARAACAVALAVVWAVPIVSGGGPALTALNDLAVLAAAAVALAGAAGAWTRAAASALVVSLGGERRPGGPVTAQLARALGDPALELRYAVPGLGWLDESGRPVPAPDGGLVTRAVVPDGGEVALIHAAPLDPRLAAAAASAAGLALDSARLGAELRARSEDVRASRRRLLTAEDAERRALEARLDDRVLRRLRRVERRLGPPLRAELQGALAELDALGRGLYPPAVLRADVAEALAELAARAPLPVAVDVRGAVERLPEPVRAAVWFICAEALANVARHAGATAARVTLAAEPDRVLLTVADDGRGGAAPARGLRGIADRAEALGGTLALDSPPGGPTRLRVELPYA
jgi:hypothetical protein